MAKVLNLLYWKCKIMFVCPCVHLFALNDTTGNDEFNETTPPSNEMGTKFS